jgi:hypothetical protein
MRVLMKAAGNIAHHVIGRHLTEGTGAQHACVDGGCGHYLLVPAPVFVAAESGGTVARGQRP